MTQELWLIMYSGGIIVLSLLIIALVVDDAIVDDEEMLMVIAFTIGWPVALPFLIGKLIIERLGR